MATITSAQVGTAVVAGAGTFKGLVVTLPIAANADARTPLTLLDSTAAAASGPVIYSAYLSDLTAFLFAAKPNSVPSTPAMPAAPPVGTVLANATIPFTNGLYVKSCPTNVTFTSS